MAPAGDRMSAIGIVAKKTALAAALTALTDVTGYVYAPKAYKPGDAWPRWGGAEAAETGAYARTFTHAYQVVVVLPADMIAADTWVSEHLDDIVDALADLLAITEIQYARLPAEGSQAAYHAMIIVGETE